MPHVTDHSPGACSVWRLRYGDDSASVANSAI
jgi:hypothetical protein